MPDSSSEENPTDFLLKQVEELEQAIKGVRLRGPGVSGDVVLGFLFNPPESESVDGSN